MYVDYTSALEMCGLESLFTRREHRSLRFAIKSTNHPTYKDMFPTNSSQDTHLIRNRKHFQVKMCLSEKYKKSAVPVLQRRLNIHMNKLKEINRAKEARS